MAASKPPLARPQYSCEIDIKAPVSRVFAHVDDVEKMAWHMSQRSMPLMGGSMAVKRMSVKRTGKGSIYRWTGKVLGLTIDFSEKVTHWVKNKEKVWETIGTPKLIILGGYEMSFKLEAIGRSTKLTFAISYELPKGVFGNLLGRLLAPWYSRWCLKNMTQDAKAALEHGQG